jgi:hypothetical protein
VRPIQAAPGGFRAWAKGQRVEVRDYDGELIRTVTPHVARQLLENELVDELAHSLRLKLGVRWLPPRLDKASGDPDLEQMRKREPERYADIWRGAGGEHAAELAKRAKGASTKIGPTFGRAGSDRTVHFGRR